ncbi:hypothetical protein LXA43DRAFT_898452, partial [Ganoderma leucocontextum]
LHQYAFMLRTTACPCLVMAMSGSLVMFYAVYFTDKLYATKLCQFDLDGPVDVLNYARFQVMRNTGRMLREYYTNLHTGCNLFHTPQLFPQPSSIISQHPLATPTSIAEFTSLDLFFHDRVPDMNNKFDTHRFLFKGTVWRCDARRRLNVYVKFVEHYGNEVHSYLASHNPPFAPQLLYCAEIIPRVTMVIMQDLEGKTIEGCLSLPDDVISIIQPQAEEALKVLHAGGFVHGDLRQPNIVVQPTAQRVFFIDFDWAGKKETAKYPRHLNPHIQWIRPAYQLEGKVIKKRDDVHMLQQALAAVLKHKYVKANSTLSKRSAESKGEDDDALPSKRSREDDDPPPA